MADVTFSHIDAAGKPLWRFRTAGEVDANPRLSHDGELVLVGSDDGNLYAVRRDSGQRVRAGCRCGCGRCRHGSR